MSAPPRCHYIVLDVERTATDDELKKAYRVLAKAPPQGPCTPKHVKSPQRPFRTPV